MCIETGLFCHETQGRGATSSGDWRSVRWSLPLIAMENRSINGWWLEVPTWPGKPRLQYMGSPDNPSWIYSPWLWSPHVWDDPSINGFNFLHSMIHRLTRYRLSERYWPQTGFLDTPSPMTWIFWGKTSTRFPTAMTPTYVTVINGMSCWLL